MRHFMFSSLCVALVFVVQTTCSDKNLLNGVVDATSKLLKFFSTDYEHINLDGLFGLRLGQGQLLDAIRSCKAQANCRKSALLFDLLKLEREVSVTCSKAVEIVQDNDPEYFKRFHDTVDSPYILPNKPQTFFPDELAKAKVGSNYMHYDEDKGDACYARIMGTYLEKGSYLPKCNVTNSCWKYMTLPETQRYTITHQLLYFILIDKIKCTEKVEDFVGDLTIRDVQHRLCRNIYKEGKMLAASGDVANYQRDLFLEQVSLCGPLGFVDFMKEKWIAMTLSWPDKDDGCFKRNYYRHKRAYESNASTMRKLLREKNMKDGCLSHTSGLGFSAFSTFLRHLVDQL